MRSSRFKDITTVWFDIDDTIVDFSANSRKTLAMIHGYKGIDRHFDDVADWTLCYERHNRALWELFNNGEVTADYLRLARFVGPLTERGMSHDDALALARELDPLYLSVLAERPGVIEGARELIAALHERGYELGVISNGFSGVQEKKLVTAGVDTYIKYVVLSDTCGINKPMRGIFDAAMRMAGDTNPEHHLMVGDNPVTDVAGAVGAGWHAIFFDRRGAEADTFRHRTLRVDRLSQILPLLPGKAAIGS